MGELFADLDAAFVARDLHRLRHEITTQSDDALAAADIYIPSSCTSLMLSLFDTPRSASELSEALGYSHQLTTQRINQLIAADLIARVPSKLDARKKDIVLTEVGRLQTLRLRALLPKIDDAFVQLFEEIGVPLGAACRSALQCLEARPLTGRIKIDQFEKEMP